MFKVCYDKNLIDQLSFSRISVRVQMLVVEKTLLLWRNPHAPPLLLTRGIPSFIVMFVTHECICLRYFRDFNTLIFYVKVQQYQVPGEPPAATCDMFCPEYLVVYTYHTYI